MKNAIKLFTCLVVFVAMSTYSDAQQNSQKCCNSISLERSIKFEGSSDTEEITIEVNEDIKMMHLGVNGIISSGQLTVEVYDPKGDKYGNFSIESQIKSNDKKREKVCGQMQRQIEKPMKGKWVVKLIPVKVSGDISIHAMQS